MTWPKTFEEAMEKARSRPQKPRKPMGRGEMSKGTPKMRQRPLRQRYVKAKVTVDGDSEKDIKRELDQLVRDIIKLRDDRCFTCGRARGTVNLEVGHMYHRGIQVLRWSLVNCHAQCGGFAGSCNAKHEEDPGTYQLAFIKAYCMDDFFDMETLSNSSHKHSYIELLGIRDGLRAILGEMKHATSGRT